MEILLDAGADPEHSDDISGTPLHGAARRNHSTSCKLLLNRGARVDAADGVGNRPLHLAAAEGAMSALQVWYWKRLLWGRALLSAVVRDSDCA